MNTLAAVVYWIIVVLWLSILATVFYFYVTNRRSFGTTRLLLMVLALDASRNIIENTYFGLCFGSKYGVLPAALARHLGNPHYLILPKLLNIVAGCVVLCLLLWRWLPAAIRERTDAERQAEFLHQKAITDSMTGLLNRAQFLALAHAEWERFSRYKAEFSLLIIDIDYFKAVNDRYGHQMGDQVIIMVAKLCSANKRGSDIIGRLGGEEFGMLLLETPEADAVQFAEGLRDLIAKAIVTMQDGCISMTASIGVSGSARARSVSHMFKHSDMALYEAKRTGRNRVCYFSQLEAAHERDPKITALTFCCKVMQMHVNNALPRHFVPPAQAYDAAGTVQREVAARLAARITASAARPRHILEIGCGTGFLSAHLAKLFPAAELSLTDVALRPMLESCRSRLGNAHRYVLLDGEHPEHLDKKFDLIVSSLAVQWFGNLRQGLAGLCGLLEPGGRLIFSTLGAASFVEWRRAHWALGLECGTPNYPAPENFPWPDGVTHQLQTEYLAHRYKSGRDFIRSVKTLGAREPVSGYQRLSAGNFRRLLAATDAEFAVTYHILYGEILAR